jgi:REP element-mobilizing transposase RayT
LECGGAPPLLRRGFKSKIIVFRLPFYESDRMPMAVTPWPHAPTHQLSEHGTYFVTAGTHFKAHHFRTPERLDLLQRGLLAVARDFSWNLEAWAVFSNHYHFVAQSPGDSKDAKALSQMLGVLHTRIAGCINRLDRTPARKVWHNFWDTKLTYQKSYLVRLNYVHQNAVKRPTSILGVRQDGWSVSLRLQWCDQSTDLRPIL